MKHSVLFVAFFVIVLVSAAFITVQDKDAQILIVNVTLDRPPDDDAAKIITQVDARISYVTRMEIARDTPLFTPGITVLVLQDLEEKSGWNSVPIPAGGSIYGEYGLKVRLNNAIDKNRPLRILARVVGPDGNEISVKATDLIVS